MSHDFIFANTIQEICDKPSTVAGKFRERGIVAFRGSTEDRSELGDEPIVRLAQAVGDIVGFTPSANRSGPESVSMESWRYHQTQDDTVQYLIDDNVNTSSQELIQWHIEGVSLKHTQRAAVWYMYHFTAEPGTGSTGFVDMQMLYTKLPAEYKNLLDSATIIHIPNWQSKPKSKEEFAAKFKSKCDAGHDVIWTEDTGKIVGSFSRPAVQENPNTGVPTLRVCPCEAEWGVQDYLLKVDGRKPTEAEQETFYEAVDWILKEIRDPENQIWWEWQQEDLVMPDLFRMAHGVHGGFQPGQRSFYGYWCFPFGVGEEPIDVISDEEYQTYLANLSL